MITIRIDDRQLQDALQRLQATCRDMRPAMKDIGEELMQSTKARFSTSTAPDGTPWAPNSRATIEHYLAARGGYSRRTGRITARGTRLAIGKRPLIGETRALSSTIRYQLLGNDGVAIGSNQVYSATQQFGARKGQFGTDRRGHPIPWGAIPARPFLGVSDQDRQKILDIVREHLESAFT